MTSANAWQGKELMRRRFRSVVGLVVIPAVLLCSASPATAQAGAKKGEWPTYGGDLGNTRYSALDQLTAENFNELEVAWRFKTDFLGPRPEFRFEATPLMTNGVVYSTGGSRRAVVALDAATGEPDPNRRIATSRQRAATQSAHLMFVLPNVEQFGILARQHRRLQPWLLAEKMSNGRMRSSGRPA